jgi:hypothetical protein
VKSSGSALIVEVAKLDHALFEVGREARADAPAGGGLDRHGGVGNEPFVGDPQRVVGRPAEVLDRDPEGS